MGKSCGARESLDMCRFFCPFNSTLLAIVSIIEHSWPTVKDSISQQQ
jgi:hypothetical protein